MFNIIRDANLENLDTPDLPPTQTEESTTVHEEEQ